MNRSQLLTQEGTVRLIDVVLIAIKAECEEGGEQFAQNTHAILTRILTDIYKIEIQEKTDDLHSNMMF